MTLFTETVSTHTRCEILDITPTVESLVKKSNIHSGLCVVYVLHTTAAVTINENADPDVKRDLLQKLAALIPERENFYRHSEGNSDSHLKTAMVGPSVTLIIDNGRLVLGQWQGIYFCEFDGPRTRTFHIKFLSDAR